MVPFRNDTVFETKVYADRVILSLGGEEIYSEDVGHVSSPKDTATVMEENFAQFLAENFQKWMEDQ